MFLAKALHIQGSVLVLLLTVNFDLNMARYILLQILLLWLLRGGTPYSILQYVLCYGNYEPTICNLFDIFIWSQQWLDSKP